MTLDGKVAIVTGGARGIGKATALALANDGADVAVFDMLAEVKATANSIESAGRRATAHVVDITDVAAVRDAVAAVTDTLGTAGILANVAGIVADIAPLAEMDPAA
jgi:NAD(P)-dependent dehydrogenase (short-subunit alcohol dehydrogenase family)